MQTQSFKILARIITVCFVLSVITLATSVLASDKYGGGSSGSSSSSSSGGTSCGSGCQANRAYNERTLTPSERGLSGDIRPGMTVTREIINGRPVDVYRDSYTPGGAPPSRTAYRDVVTDSSGNGGGSDPYVETCRTALTTNGFCHDTFFEVPAIGYFDSVNSANCSVQGWAFDPDNPSTSIDIHVYRDGAAGSGGTMVTSCTANLSRPDVNSAYRITGQHGFSCSLPESFASLGSRNLFIHAIDISGSPNRVLSNSPRSINCAPPPPPPPVVSISLSSGSQPLVRNGSIVSLNWTINTTAPLNCSINGVTNNGTFTVATSNSGTVVTQPMANQTIFTLRCTGADFPGQEFTDDVTVKVVPSLMEV